MPSPSTATAASREAAWLNAFGDGLPALSVDQGGPWSVIQAYDPRTPGKKKTGVYVTRPSFAISRFANVRQLARYTFHVKVVWPLSNIGGSEEVEQASFDSALELVVQRILGLPQDKTHGGRFLSVAETPDYLTFIQDDPVATIPNTANFTGTFTYNADDFEYYG